MSVCVSNSGGIVKVKRQNTHYHFLHCPNFRHKNRRILKCFNTTTKRKPATTKTRSTTSEHSRYSYHRQTTDKNRHLNEVRKTTPSSGTHRRGTASHHQLPVTIGPLRFQGHPADNPGQQHPDPGVRIHSHDPG